MEPVSFNNYDTFDPPFLGLDKTFIISSDSFPCRAEFTAIVTDTPYVATELADDALGIDKQPQVRTGVILNTRSSRLRVQSFSRTFRCAAADLKLQGVIQATGTVTVCSHPSYSKSHNNHSFLWLLIYIVYAYKF